MSSIFLRRAAFRILTVFALGTAPAHAIEGMSLELGTGDDVNMGRIGVQWGSWQSQKLRTQSWHIGGYYEVAIGYWKYDHTPAPTQHGSLVNFGFTPVIRAQPNGLKGPYAEIGLGMHLISNSSIGDTSMSTAFQFGSHAGIGYRFGATDAFDIGYRFQHLSNAGIKHPNAGINFQQIRLQYSF